jgi:hypothetical protein
VKILMPNGGICEGRNMIISDTVSLSRSAALREFKRWISAELLTSQRRWLTTECRKMLGDKTQNDPAKGNKSTDKNELANVCGTAGGLPGKRRKSPMKSIE